MGVALEIVGIVVLLATLLPLLHHDQWWIRIFDFPRMQIAALTIFVACALVLQWRPDSDWRVLLTAGLVAAAAYQGYKMFPFTPLASRQVLSAKRGDGSASVSVLVANVLVSNRSSGPLLSLIREKDPDVVFTVETDEWWEQELRLLEATHPFTVKRPRDDTYGMALYSRFPLHDAQVKYICEYYIPSIHAWVELPCGVRVRLYGLHPAPPYPKYAEETTDRDAELFLVGKQVRRMDSPTIVMGDLNDVAWSYTTTLFQKTSGLLDPRKGRGAYNTFHASIPFLRCPVDHVFVSSDFLLIKLERLRGIGSDHFPILARLQYSPQAARVTAEPQANGAEAEEVDQKIAASVTARLTARPQAEIGEKL